MAAPLNVAIIGYGRMGQLYAQTIRTQVPEARLLAVVEAADEARAKAAADLAPPHLFADAEAALALPDLDAVVIAAPTSAHAKLVIAAAAAGKAIFCEKPLALTLADTHAALDAVRRAGVPLQVGFMRRFDPAYQHAQALIAAGQIGTPVTFKSVGRDPFCPRPAYADPALSGGLIIDMGIHDFDLARWMVGSEVTRVSAEGALLVCQDLAAVGDIDNATINLRFASGALGNVEVSRNAFYGYDIRTEVLGSEGAVLVGRHQHLPVLLLNRAGAHTDVAPYLAERFGPAYQAQLQHFVQAVRAGNPPAVGGEDALAAFSIGLAATRSAQQDGAPVAISDLGAG